jgi:hypothetical protein
MRRGISLMVCSVACLAIAAPVALADASFDGQYVGQRVLTNGPADVCPTEDYVSVTIHGNVLTLTSSALKNYEIGFVPRRDGTFDETHVHIGGDVADIQGHVGGGGLDAQVINPPCEHYWSLKKK